MKNIYKIIVILLISLLVVSCKPQNSTNNKAIVEFNVELPENTSLEDNIYIMGSFSHEKMKDWDPSDESGKAVRNGNIASFILEYDKEKLPITIEYKWTRGSSNTVEASNNGEERLNRTLTINTDISINDKVIAWNDDIFDFEAPIISIPLYENNEVILNIGDEFVLPNILAIDNIDGDISEQVEINNSEILPLYNESLEKYVFNFIGNYNVIYSVSDLSNNKATLILKITVVDNVAPVITTNPNYENNRVILNTGDSFVLPSITAIDNVDGILTEKIIIDDSEISMFYSTFFRRYILSEAGEFNLSFKVSDLSNNETVLSIKIIVIDTVAPVITTNPTYSNNRVLLTIGTEFKLPEVTANDNVDGNISEQVELDDSEIEAYYIEELDAYIFIDEGEFNLIFFVEDEANNYAELIITIIIIASGSEIIFEGYYESLNGLSGNDLVDELYIILNNTGTYETTTYGEARYIMEESDIWVGYNEEYMYLIYSDSLRKAASTNFAFDGYGIPNWQGTETTWNREHVWAKSLFLGGNADPNNNGRGIGADMHNLRAADTNVNSSRGNNKFINQVYVQTTYGFGNFSSMWYPGDHHRGDVARILFYMDIRWGNLTDLTMIGDLNTLIAWHEADPVDEFEIHRNNVIFNYQKNRNPFIDYPELVEMIYN